MSSLEVRVWHNILEVTPCEFSPHLNRALAEAAADFRAAFGEEMPELPFVYVEQGFEPLGRTSIAFVDHSTDGVYFNGLYFAKPHPHMSLRHAICHELGHVRSCVLHRNDSEVRNVGFLVTPEEATFSREFFPPGHYRCTSITSMPLEGEVGTHSDTNNRFNEIVNDLFTVLICGEKTVTLGVTKGAGDEELVFNFYSTELKSGLAKVMPDFLPCLDEVIRSGKRAAYSRLMQELHRNVLKNVRRLTPAEEHALVCVYTYFSSRKIRTGKIDYISKTIS